MCPKVPKETNSGSSLEVDQELDALGLRCPEPLMLTRNAIRGMQGGQVLKVLSSDPTTELDLQKFCRFMGHELLLVEVQGDADQQVFDFWIRKA